MFILVHSNKMKRLWKENKSTTWLNIHYRLWGLKDIKVCDTLPLPNLYKTEAELKLDHSSFQEQKQTEAQSSSKGSLWK